MCGLVGRARLHEEARTEITGRSQRWSWAEGKRQRREKTSGVKEEEYEEEGRVVKGCSWGKSGNENQER